MARVEVYGDRVVIRLTASEKALAMHRKDVVIDRSAITTAIITDDPWVWLRGVRAPGTHVPGKRAYGTWRNLAGRDFVLARRGRAAVVIDTEAPDAERDRGASAGFDDYSRIIVSTTHAAELAQALLRVKTDLSEVFTTDTAE